MWNKRPPPLPVTPSPITLSKVERSDSVTSLFIEEILSTPGRVKKSPTRICVPGTGFRATWRPDQLEEVETPQNENENRRRIRHLNEGINAQPPPWWMKWVCWVVIAFIALCFLALVIAMAMTASSKSQQVESAPPEPELLQVDEDLYENSLKLHNATDAEIPTSHGQEHSARLRIDCKDHNCTSCREYLEKTDPEKICDANGKIDCEDRTDELGCPCYPDSIRCHLNPTNDECINPDFSCDGIRDCQNGEDERECIALSKNITFVESTTSNFLIKPDVVEGYVIFIRKGVWHSYCTNEWTLDLGRKLCEYFGYGHLNELRTFDALKIPDIIRKSKAQGVILNNILNLEEENSINPNLLQPYDSKDPVPVPPTCHVAYLVCTLKEC